MGLKVDSPGRLRGPTAESQPYYDGEPKRMYWPALIPHAPEQAVWRYAFAAGCWLIVLSLRLLFNPFLTDHAPLLVFTLAVSVSAMRGFGPGILCTALSALSSLCFYPALTFFRVEAAYRPKAVFQIGTFVVIGFLLSRLGGQLCRLRWMREGLVRQKNEILESITDGFAAIDHRYNLTYLNQTAAGMARNSREEAIGKSVWEEIPEWRAAVIKEQFRTVLADRVAAHFDYESLSSNRWFEFHVYPAGNDGLSAYFSDITDRKRMEQQLRQTLGERDSALQQLRVLSGLLRICAACKKICDEHGTWQPMESYIAGHSEARFSHGLCIDCAGEYMADLHRQCRSENPQPTAAPATQVESH